MKNKYSGKCLCGAVTYQVDGQPVVVAQCHCDECRRLSGTGHTIGAMFPIAAVTMNGKLNEFRYQSDKESAVTKSFCGKCGSPIFGTNSRTPDHLTLSLGSMDDATELDVQVVIFERDKKHWDQLGPDVMSFATQPDWKPDN
ncbi:GFA family protein [Maritalea sp.]|uniref:GFA family protein n=1 Tax=Maritalea sp. TaxID=2003361 RepID=UPI003EF662A2